MKGPPPLTIELGRSRIAAALVLVAHLGTAALIAWLPAVALYRAVAVLAIGAHALWTLRTWALRMSGPSIIRLEVAADGRVILGDLGGRSREGCLQPSSYVGTWLTTVVVRIEGSRRSQAVAILPDMLGAEELRLLRVLLRVAATSRL